MTTRMRDIPGHHNLSRTPKGVLLIFYKNYTGPASSAGI